MTGSVGKEKEPPFEECANKLSTMLTTLRIDLSSDSIASVSSASSLAVHIGAPVIALSRRLLDIGLDPATPLNAYRNKTLCLRVLGIGEAAKLEINGNTRFTLASRRNRRTGPTIESE